MSNDSREDELKKKKKQTDKVIQKKRTWKDEFVEALLATLRSARVCDSIVLG